MRTDWLCLEFAKTVGWEARDTQEDRLVDYQALVVWAEQHGAIDQLAARELLTEAAARPEEGEEVLDRAVSLRSLLYRLFRTIGEGGEPGSAELEGLNDYIRVAAPRRRVEERNGNFEWGWRWESKRLDIILSKIVWSAAELLTAPERKHVKACAADDCGWLFVDASRNHRRRWCDMSDCGNRAKARRFRKKHSTR